jgi:hypothetical protein
MEENEAGTSQTGNKQGKNQVASLNQRIIKFLFSSFSIG